MDATVCHERRPTRKEVATIGLPPTTAERLMKVDQVRPELNIAIKLNTGIPCINVLEKSLAVLQKAERQNKGRCYAKIGRRVFVEQSLRNGLHIHDLKKNQEEVSKENEWANRIANSLRQPLGTPDFEICVAKRFIAAIQVTTMMLITVLHCERVYPV